MVSRRLLIGGILAFLVGISGIVAAYGAKQRALGAEDAHVAARLEGAPCLDDWGTNEGSVSRDAAVTGLAPFGIRVAVTLPYAYRVDTDGEPVFADTASEAVYEVTPFTTRRVSGDEVAPCAGSR